MRTVTMFAFGSRGDTQPLVALGQGLAARGDTVRVLAAKRYEHLVTSAGLEYRTLDIDPIDILTGEVGQQWLSSRNPVSFMRGFRKIIRPMAQGVLDQAFEAAAGSDAVLAPATAFVGYHVAEKLGIPTGFLHLQPGEPTKTAANPLVASGKSIGAPLNRATYAIVEQATWQLIRSVINPWRVDTLGLRKIPRGGPFRAARKQGLPVFCGYSESVVPRPPDWPDFVHITGYWTLQESTTEPSGVDPALAAWVEDGPAPVYIGFGSMVPKDPAATRRTIREAVRKAGVRAVLMEEPLEIGAETGGPEGDDVWSVPGVPHEWLFPRTSAIVHHGGAGTTGAALRSGVPNLICPFFSDQPFWGARVAALGVGPEPLPIKDLEVDALAARLTQATTDPQMKARAAALGQTLRAEDGVANGATAVHSWLDGNPRLPGR